MPKKFGTIGKFFDSDDDIAKGIIDIPWLFESLETGDIEIPKFQREIDNDRVNKYVKFYIKSNKDGKNVLKYDKISICAIPINKNNSRFKLLLVDGQHRIEAMKILKDKDYPLKDLEVYVKFCDNYKEAKIYFKHLNKHTDMDPLYKSLENPFNDLLVDQLKYKLKDEFKDGFCSNKNGTQYHIDDFLNLFQLENLKDTNFVCKNNQIKPDKIINKIKIINSTLKKYFIENQDNFHKSTIDKMNKNGIYFTFKNYNFLECFKNDIFELSVTPQKIKKEPRIKLPKKTRDRVWDKYVGRTEREGKCFVCKDKITIGNWECSHVIAVANEGKNNLDNLRPLCKTCNRDMGIMNMNEYKKKFHPNCAIFG
jgi:hypothetical protein